MIIHSSYMYQVRDGRPAEPFALRQLRTACQSSIVAAKCRRAYFNTWQREHTTYS